MTGRTEAAVPTYGGTVTALEALSTFVLFVAEMECPYCERICLRCRYLISGGFIHVEGNVRGRFADGRVIVSCSSERYRGPVGKVIDQYLTHQEQHMVEVTVRRQR